MFIAYRIRHLDHSWWQVDIENDLNRFSRNCELHQVWIWHRLLPHHNLPKYRDEVGRIRLDSANLQNVSVCLKLGPTEAAGSIQAR